MDAPGEEFVDPVDRVIGDAGENVAEVFFRIELVESGGFDEGVDSGGTLAAGIGAGEEIVLAAEGYAAQGSLGGVVVDLDAAVIDEAGELGPARERVADGFGELGFAREFAAACFEPGLHGVEDGLRLREARGSSFVRRAAADLLFDAVERADVLQGLCCDRGFRW